MLSKDHNYEISEILDGKIYDNREIVTRFSKKHYSNCCLNVYLVSYFWIFSYWEKVGCYYQCDHIFEVYDFTFGQFVEERLSEHISGLSIRCVLQ